MKEGKIGYRYLGTRSGKLRGHREKVKLKDRALFILDYEEFLLFGDVRRASGKKITGKN